jgi:hypothetical protein
MSPGNSRGPQALHAIGSVVAGYRHDVMHSKKGGTPTAAQARCDAALERLAPAEWIAGLAGSRGSPEPPLQKALQGSRRHPRHPPYPLLVANPPERHQIALAATP